MKVSWLIKIPTALLLIIVLHACGVAPIIKENATIRVKDLSVTAPVRFSQFGSGRERYWTRDGLMLNDFRIFADVRPGESLFLSPKGRAERRGEGSLYKKGMDALEVQELFVDAFKSLGAAEVSAENLRPEPFGERSGFRFDLRFQSPGMGGGLRYRATVLAEVEGDTLSYLYFDAPEEFFFERDIGFIEGMFKSLQAPK
jgi:hypothetical protein